jgi:hypothetical protein
VENDYVAYLRESKKQTLLVLVSRGPINTTIDLSTYGYKVAKTLYGHEVKGEIFSIASDSAVQGIWELK